MSETTWPDSETSVHRLGTLDGGVHAEVRVQQPDRYHFFRQADAPKPAIARGAGLSFAAASFGGEATTIDLTSFDRILHFDPAEGVVEVEAGARLGQLFAFLEPRGIYLPTQPGYAAISVGGCIAADVHGKNPARNGTFINQVASLRIFHPRHGMVDVSPDREPALFRATCGGFGLTGIIVTARLKIKAIPSRTMETSAFGVPDLSHGVEKIAELLPGNDLVYGWHDLTHTDGRFGRGHVVAQRFSSDGSQAPGRIVTDSKLSWTSREKLPFPALNGWTVGAMNMAYRALNASRRTTQTPLFEAMFPFHGKEGYLALFGRPGFHETQVIVPRERFPDYVEALRDAVRRTKATIAFAALKMFAGQSDLTRFDGTGVSLAIHLPRNPASARLLDMMDDVLLALGGLPNAIKDSRLPRRLFEATYPDCDRFRAIVREWDPLRSFRSELSTRLGL